ncbi:MAG: hypothetical protein HFJ06_04305 [Lachnospiraceae bacterium]|nr:hypothetical protein [Lachnospiraceae bacterium]
MKTKKKNVIITFAILFIWWLIPIQTFAATIVPASGDKTGKQDYKNIMNALSKDGDIILENGSTYYLKATLWVESNQSITATGATIISKSGVFRNRPTKTNYRSLQNFSVDGGIWKNISKDGFKKSMVQFSHSKNISLKNLTVYCNYAGHAVELVACRDVTIDNCTLKGIGKCSKSCSEEQLQIDIATQQTAPTVGHYNKKFVKGQTCQNITVTNCKITGARGVCANYTSKEKKYQTKFHKNIILKNNTIIGTSAEGVALFNVIGATVENNTIISHSKRTDTAYSVGCHIAMFGKAPASIKKAVYRLENNTIKGGRQGFYVYSHSASRFGKVIAKRNRCYAKKGKSKAIWVRNNSVHKIELSVNKTYKWK